jgi:hypothetical protein
MDERVGLLTSIEEFAMTNCWSETRLSLVSANPGRLLGDIEQALTDDGRLFNRYRLWAVISIGRIIRASLPAECSDSLETGSPGRTAP